MNSKKKLTSLGFMLFFILMHNLSAAQPFNYSSPNFNISLPAINTPVPPANTPYYTLFIEAGNGKYFKVPSATNPGSIDGSRNSNNSYPYSYYIADNSKAVITVSALYDTTPRPPRNIAIKAGNSSSTNFDNIPNLSFNTRIAIDPCVDDIVPGDTMAVALTYKPFNSVGGNTIIAFYYNKTFEGGNIFGAIDDQTTNFFYPHSLSKPNPVNAIRKFNDEVFTSTLTSLPLSVQQNLALINSGYTNVLYFLIPSGASETEKNIFLTLVPTTNISSYSPVPDPSSSTQFFAKILKYNARDIIDSQTVSYNLGIDLYARDPNGINVFPQCFEQSFGNRPYNRPLPVIIDFQNVGTGWAYTVETTLTVPDGIQVPGTITDAYLRTNDSYRLLRKWDGRGGYYYKIEGRKIKFVMPGINLHGRGNASNSWGQITFTLRTNPEVPPQPPIPPRPQIPECMYFDLSIVFKNKNGTSNAAVTKSVLARLHCKSANFNCPRKSKYGIDSQ